MLRATDGEAIMSLLVAPRLGARLRSIPFLLFAECSYDARRRRASGGGA